MTAVDTNVLVRLLAGDDPAQAAVTESLLASDEIWIGKTVILETAWVLRTSYGFDESSVIDALTKLLGLDNVRVEDERAVAAALSLAKTGIEFDDAMHVCGCSPDATFVSFDRNFVRRAKRAGISNISLLS